MEYKGNDFYCDVALKDIVALKVEHENANVLAFHHTRPHWPVHIVVIPKKHIPSFTDRADSDESIFQEVLQVVKMIAERVEKKYGEARILTNLGNYQDSKHLHFHISSGKEL
jgi:histidine triad (HIT) family protein